MKIKLKKPITREDLFDTKWLLRSGFQKQIIQELGLNLGFIPFSARKEVVRVIYRKEDYNPGLFVFIKRGEYMEDYSSIFYNEYPQKEMNFEDYFDIEENIPEHENLLTEKGVEMFNKILNTPIDW